MAALLSYIQQQNYLSNIYVSFQYTRLYVISGLYSKCRCYSPVSLFRAAAMILLLNMRLYRAEYRWFLQWHSARTRFREIHSVGSLVDIVRQARAPTHTAQWSPTPFRFRLQDESTVKCKDILVHHSTKSYILAEDGRGSRGVDYLTRILIICNPYHIIFFLLSFEE